jgi:hypothetical protein
MPPIGETNMDQVDRMLDRPKLYYNIDGVGELGLGFGFLAFSLLGSMQVHAPKGSVWHSMYLFIIYLGLMYIIIKYGSKAIKKHITYPRTGFVEYRKHGTFWLPMAMTIGALTTVGLSIALRRHWDLTTLVVLYGLLLAGGYAYRLAWTVRWKWLVASAMAFISLLIAVFPRIWIWLDPTWIGALWLTFMLYGALLLISGGISFWLYLCHTQAPAQENQ